MRKAAICSKILELAEADAEASPHSGSPSSFGFQALPAASFTKADEADLIGVEETFNTVESLEVVLMKRKYDKHLSQLMFDCHFKSPCSGARPDANRLEVIILSAGRSDILQSHLLNRKYPSCKLHPKVQSHRRGIGVATTYM